MNEVIVTGRLVSNPKFEKNDNGNKVAKIILAITRCYKNASGEYDTDFIDCEITGQIAKNLIEYCKKGDLIGVRGKLKKEKFNYPMVVVGERITFLRGGNKDE